MKGSDDLSPVLAGIKEGLISVLGENLVGIYVHGSIAFGCYTQGISDVDYVAVVKNPLSLSQKEKIIAQTLELESLVLPKGIEMHVLGLEDCKNFIHPCPFMLHYSSAYRREAAQTLTEYCQRMNGTDPDLAAHLTVINSVGTCLYGPPVSEVFSPVPSDDYLDSILFDVANAETEILSSTVYVTLNLCRVMAYVRDGLILSKRDGGKWGLTNLPAKYGGLIRSALESYAGRKGAPLSEAEKTEFARDLCQSLFRAEK